MAAAPLPAFIIIGAAKAATTWIAHQLRVRDDVFMPAAEPHFFSRDYARGEEWYRGLFATAGPDQMVGEKSADYLADFAAPRRIAALLPKVQLIAQLRNPVERAYSDYCMLFRRGQIDDDVARQLNRATTDAPRFLDDGLYARHLRRFLAHFPEEQLTLIFHEDIQADPLGSIGRVCAAIGLPMLDNPPETVLRINDKEAPLVPMALRSLPQPVKRAVKPLRGSAPFEAARRLIARPVHYPPLTMELRHRLTAFYEQDIAELGSMLGRDLSRWLRVPEPQR